MDESGLELSQNQGRLEDIILCLSPWMGGFRSKPDTQKHTVAKQSLGLTYAVSSMCGSQIQNLGWRLYMEDAHIATLLSDRKSHLFAVFDGHGGAEVAIFVSKHFVHELEVNKNYVKKNYELALKETFLKMDQMLQTNQGKHQIAKIQKQLREQENAPKYEQQSHAGCTANVCLITPEFVYVANAGDSRAVVCSLKGEAKQLSRDHKPDDKAEKARIVKAGGTIQDGRINGNLNLSRAIGDFEYKNCKNLPAEEQMITANPEITKIKNQGLDFLIMGCDGIWETKTSGQMVGWLKARMPKKSLGAVLQQLLSELLSKDSNKDQKGLDNMSAILVKFIKTKK